ncbi:MAG: ArsC family reductase [Gammaproteobacteria bacterium]|jgi:Spx/MgsR family transcriptional regulator
MIIIYGIPNCDTIKKARKWLEANGLEYEFHDYRKHGVPESKLRNWVKQTGWETVLNKRGTTWRRLDEKTRNNINQDSAVKTMLANPGIIKRPVLESGKVLIIGFNEIDYQQLL